MQIRYSISLHEAQEVAQAARKVALENQWNVAIAVVDEGGHLVYLERLDNTQPGSIPVAQEKALSALLFRRPTKVFQEAVAAGRTGLLSLTGAVPVEGGVPLVNQGQVIGAIGVSGVQAAQDGQVAEAGAAVAGAFPRP
jgi:uncharacterized protein GlcG (DUF336 family)